MQTKRVNMLLCRKHMARDLRPVKIIMTVAITSTMLKRDKKKQQQINKEKQIDNKMLDLLLNIFALRN